MKPLTRPLLARLHLYLGTAVAPLLLVITATGILLGFYDPLRYGDFPWRVEAAVQHPLPPAALAAVLRTQLPEYHLDVLYLPTAPERSARAKLSGTEDLLIFAHPQSGALLAMQPAERQDWLAFFYALHRGEVAGLGGQIAASAAGAVVVALGMIGIALWSLRRRHACLAAPAAGLRMRLLRLHRLLGLWLGTIIVLWVTLGALLNFAGPLIKLFNPPPQIAQTDRQALREENIVARAARAYPVALERIYFPKDARQPWQFRFQDGGRIYMDGGSGQILRRDTPFSHWTSALYPLHSGRFLGDWGPPVVALLGIALLVLSLSGLTYWRRRPVRRSARYPAHGNGR